MIHKKIIEGVKKNDFTINYTTESSSILIHQKINNYLFEFIVQYQKDYFDVVDSTYFDPSEFSINYKPTSIDSLVIYDLKSNIVEFSDKEIDALKYEVEKKILIYN